MKVAIRVDASKMIGNGHVMRCLALAKGLSKFGADVLLITRQNDTTLAHLHLLENKNIRYKILDSLRSSYNKNSDNYESDLPTHSHWLTVDWHQDAAETQFVLRNQIFDFLVVDHYALNHCWESMLRPYVKKIMVIDDLADRRHDCDVILDSVCGRNKTDYSNLSGSDCLFLLGTKYTLLRPEFYDWRSISLQKRKDKDTVSRILVSMGGVDFDDMTGSVMDQLVKVDLPLKCEINIIVGTEYPHIDKLSKRIAKSPVKTTLDVGVDDMARRIVEADFGIGAFGVSTWERCCLGLPSINIITEKNQTFSAKALKKEKIGEVIFAESLNDELVPAIKFAVENFEYRRKLTSRSSELVDGKGVSRVVDWLESEL